MPLGAWIVSLIGPVMARWLASMGLSLIVLVGVRGAVDQLRSSMLTAFGGLPADAVALCGLAGIWEGCGILLGAMTFVLTWRASAGFWSLGKAS